MVDKKAVYCGELNIITNIPIKHIVEAKISIQENKHAVLFMKVITGSEKKENVNSNMYIGEKICLSRGNEKLFIGEIEKINYYCKNSYQEMEIWSYSASAQLDREKRKCSFQDPSMTYEQVVNKVIQKKEGAKAVWNEEKGQKICYPIIQYEETNWDFLKRLASHFHTVLYADEISGEIKFYFGMNKGREIDLNDLEIIKFGYNNDYYSNGAYSVGLSRSSAHYIECRSTKKMRIGDYVTYQGCVYIISRINIFYRNGETIFLYLLQQNGIDQEKIYNSHISGIYLRGTVVETSKENICVRLDINKEEENLYGWPFLPVTGNMLYCMPEIGTNVMIHFPSCDEREGGVVNVLNINSHNKNVQERELATNYGKKICMYPEYMELSTKVGKICLSDMSGEDIYSTDEMKMIAQEKIRIEGRHVKIIAPSEILCKTPEANIDLCRDINFYASAGVLTQGSDNRINSKVTPIAINEVEEEGQWKSFFTAIAAIPVIDISQVDQDSIVDLKACGSIAKFAEGSTIIAMQEVMAGKKESEVCFPHAFESMQAFTIKGGYVVPSVDRVEGRDNSI